MNSSALNSLKTFFGYRTRHYQFVSQIETDQSQCMIDENTSCLDDQVKNMPSKQIDEIIPLINETSFHQTNLIQPASPYTNDTRPDVDMLDC